jgi:hypothetical protein
VSVEIWLDDIIITFLIRVDFNNVFGVEISYFIFSNNSLNVGVSVEFIESPEWFKWTTSSLSKSNWTTGVTLFEEVSNIID